MSRFGAALSKLREAMKLPNMQELVTPSTIDSVLFNFAPKTQEEGENMKTRWRQSDDSVLGGRSRATLNFESTPCPPNDAPDVINNNSVGDFIRWSGVTDTRVGDKTVKRSGFCSILSPEFRLDLGNCNALSLTLRSNHLRNFMVNIHVDNFLPGEMYQGYMVPRKSEIGEWVTVELPFRKFLLTSMGQVKNTQDSNLTEYEEIERIGFTIADKIDGPFELDIKRIEAITLDRAQVVHDSRKAEDEEKRWML